MRGAGPDGTAGAADAAPRPRLWPGVGAAPCPRTSTEAEARTASAPVVLTIGFRSILTVVSPFSQDCKGASPAAWTFEEVSEIRLIVAVAGVKAKRASGQV